MAKLITLICTILFCIPTWAKDYGLKVGQQAPSIPAQTDISKRSFDFEKITKSKHLVLVFYRGGWCPYCNLQLRKLQQDVAPQLKKLNAEMVAISVDKADKGLATLARHKLSFYLLSDSKASIHKAYNVVNKLSDKEYKRLKNYSVDVEEASGEKHHIVAVPAIIILKKGGTVAHNFANPNYKVREKNSKILDVLGEIQ